MEFTFETQYNAQTMAIMAKALRKTIRRKHSRRSHVFGWIVMVLGALLLLANFAFDFRTLVTSIALIVMLIVLLFEDRINGYFAKKRLLPGMEKSTVVFTEESFTSTTDVGVTTFYYDKILFIAETKDFFVFVFSASHAQLYDKRQLQGGTAEEFRQFIGDATGKPVIKVK